MLRVIVATSLLFVLGSTSFCGDSTIPFSLEVLPDGQPLLGCARPTCFGWAPSGQRASNNAQFDLVQGHADGFVRQGRASIPSYGHQDSRYFLPQTSLCEPYFSSSKCAQADQWVGGIAPLNSTADPLHLRCCAFEALFESEDRGIATVNAGQIVNGGEVVNSRIQAGFDYISDIRKVWQADGSVQYFVSIRRMRCPALKEDHEESTGNYRAESGNAIAFQAPNVAVDQPLPLPPSSVASSVTNNVVEQASQSFNNQPPPVNQQQPFPQQYQPNNIQPPPSQSASGYQSQVSSCQANPSPMYYSAVSFGCGGQFCFSGDMTVEVVDGTTKRMDQLTKTDWVLTLSEKELVYEPVEFWLHRVPTQEAEFNVFETEDGKTIKLTDKHYIFKGDCSQLGAGAVNVSTLPREAVTADQVHAGDCLYTMWEEDRQMHEVLVVRSSKVTQTGIYAPMTNSGRIIVNGVHASCHNIIQEHTAGHALFEYVTMANQWYEAIFGADPDEIVETPTGLSTILAMADLIIPKSMGSM